MPSDLVALNEIAKQQIEQQRKNAPVQRVQIPKKAEQPIVEKKIPKVEKMEIVEETFEEEIASTVPETKEIEEVVKATVPVQESKPKPQKTNVKNTIQNSTTYDELPPNHPAKFVKRDDQPASQYSKKGFPSSYTIYDKKLRKILKNFSDDNQYNDGCPIPQSFIIESMMGILFYDLGIEPIGYQTKEEFLQDIKERLNIE